ncbi:MAG: 4'-phosphopantetheinyl transferase superfamily protein [Desulfuromonadales bacterium]|nr:4'-phosphopantetheinyl transferase superfamily protein [Desulfuromonadales bacterium]MBN2793748.1 4'-phosphopantetheinyl transferase superfamily protein [Desulfuromonadales bacterium]
MTAEISLWQPIPSQLIIKRSDVHLWALSLTPSSAVVERFRALLNQEEQLRAAKLATQDIAERFIIARASLRLILGRYLQLKPNQILLHYNDQGKPALDSCHQSPLCFNLAHSHNQALLALGCYDELGVDIEYLDPALDYQGILDRYFSALDREGLKRLSPLRRRRGFYRLWTSREAQLKRNGQGLPGLPAFGHADLAPQRYIPLPDGYLGCLAVSSGIKQIQRFRVTESESLFLPGHDHHLRR